MNAPWTADEIVEHLRARADELVRKAQEPGTSPKLHDMRWRSAVDMRAIADEIEAHKGPPRRRAA